MHSTPSKPLFTITVPQPKALVKRATVTSVSQRQKVTTAQALKGYAYLKSHSSRSNSAR
ncbi:MAG: hypothetical protein WCP35_04105 [Verrucomicrobiota bacterium]